MSLRAVERFGVRGAAKAARTESGAPRVLLTTEGTYPYVTGGVSSWCDLLLRELSEFEWQVLPIIGPHGRKPIFVLPPYARHVGPIEIWSETLPAGRRLRPGSGTWAELPAVLVRGLVGWEGDPDGVVEALTWCRRSPAGVRRSFRSREAWNGFVAALREVLAERVAEAGAPPVLDLVEAALLYQRLYWVARTAAVPTPPTDVLLVTASGWSAIPALVHNRLYGTPLILAEHGVYVRESYLDAATGTAPPGIRFIATRLARGLTRVTYTQADVVAPVSDANALWERSLGIDPDKIVVVHNGVRRPGDPAPPPGTRTIVSVGRVDPLKDVHTMLHVAAETLRHVPDARFLHYGPVPDGQGDYARSCRLLHERLDLGGGFRFEGRTTDPEGVVRAADVALLTSISEGLPLSILEAMGQARPVVSTSVGGVPDMVKGCGVLAPPGDVHGLAIGLVMLLRDPALALRLGRNGYHRLGRVFSEGACTERYRYLLGALAIEPGRTKLAALRHAA